MARRDASSSDGSSAAGSGADDRDHAHPVRADDGQRDFDPEYESVAKATRVGEIAFEHRLYKSPAHSVFLLRALIGLEGIVRRLAVRRTMRMFRECVESAER